MCSDCEAYGLKKHGLTSSDVHGWSYNCLWTLQLHLVQQVTNVSHPQTCGNHGQPVTESSECLFNVLWES